MPPEQQTSDRSVSEDLNRTKLEAREIGTEIAEIATDLRLLAEKEVQLAKAEVAEQASLTVRAVIWGLATGLLALILLTFVFLTVMFTLNAFFFELWAAALITTAIVLVITGIAAFLAYQRFGQISLVPQRTVKSLQEDLAWARSQLTSSAR